MDKYNVINQIDSLSDLENDMFEWSRLPMKFKHMSNDACIKQHGMTNLQYYENIKTKLLNQSSIADILDDSIHEEYSILDKEIEDREGHKERLQASRQLQQSPYIVLIDLEDYSKTYPELLINKYDTYRNLPPKYRKWCDYYSKDIYGLTVTDMFKVLKNLQNDEHDISASEDTDDVKTTMSTVQYFTNTASCECNLIDVLTYKSLNYIGLDESYRDRWMEDNMVFDTELDFDSIFNKITPYFTPEEYNKLSENQLVETLDYSEWKIALKEALKEGNEQKIIDLGWNPSVPFNEKTQEFARNRQIAWFKDHSPQVVDITNIDNQLIFEPVDESSKMMNDLYAEKNLYPVYVVMSYSDTLFGNLEKFVKKVEYTHAGLCFDSDLKEIFTFSFGKDWNGFVTDSLKTYLDNSKKATMSVICVFVDKETRDNMYRNINYLQDHKENTKYGFGNIVNILLNRAKRFPYPENLSMVCSQFVDMMFKLVDINITGKSSNLVIPQDFKKAYSSKAYVYKVYEGLCIKYKESTVENIIKRLFLGGKVENIRYPVTNPLSFLKEPIKEYTDIIEEIQNILTPRPVIENILPFRFNKNGDLEVQLYKSLEDQYQDSHKLLLSYDENNIEGIKRELAHMFYINSVIEKRIRKMKKNDDEYKSLIDLRARVLNDFKKYFVEVGKLDKDFDFSEYYQHSDYNMNVIKIDNPTLKYSGQTIKRIVGTILRFKK